MLGVIPKLAMWKVLVLLLVGTILYLIPLRMVNLYREGKLTAASFSLTLTTGWCLAILVLFYLGLADVLLSRRDPVLAALGLGIAGPNFVIGYPIARLCYRYVLTPLLKRRGQM
jgi:hypothetical protein